MKTLNALLLTILLSACAHEKNDQDNPPGTCTPINEAGWLDPVRRQELLGRYVGVNICVESFNCYYLESEKHGVSYRCD